MQKHLARMTLEEKCAQMVSADYRFDNPDPGRAVELAQSGVGGFSFFFGNIFELTPLINSLQSRAKYPLLMSADYEEGVGLHIRGATVLPCNMAVGATGSEELARLKGKVTAVESLALGVPWILAPVVDLQSNPLNPVISTRAFGEEVSLVVRLARAFAAGARGEGAITCAKHFPGHGDVSVDSHLVLPTIEHDAARLREQDMKPYVELGDAVDSVMMGHLLVPALDPDRPASLSAKVTTEVLRGELGFGGLICTDALMMGGVTKVVPEAEALVLAANAGSDALLYPEKPEAAAGVLADAVRSGKLSEKRVGEAVERILVLKERAGLFAKRHADPSRIEEVVGCEEHREAARRIAEAAVTKVRDERSVLPVSGKISFVSVEDESCRGDLTVFRGALSELLEIEEGDPVPGRPCVIAVFFKQRAFAGKTGLDDAWAEQIREIAGRVPGTVVVAFGSPYVIRQFPDVPAYVCTFSEDAASQRAAARAVAGEIPFRGTLPINLGV